ncbi:hypothetical protein CRG98_026458, partial [Punica granatum]
MAADYLPHANFADMREREIKEKHCTSLVSLAPSPSAIGVHFPSAHRSIEDPPFVTLLESIGPSKEIAGQGLWQKLKEMGYIGAHGVAALHRYKYSGADHSYLAKYVLQPFWSRFVNFFPLWMPPNMITLTGFLFLVTSALLGY